MILDDAGLTAYSPPKDIQRHIKRLKTELLALADDPLALSLVEQQIERLESFLKPPEVPAPIEG